MVRCSMEDTATLPNLLFKAVVNLSVSQGPVRQLN